MCHHIHSMHTCKSEMWYVCMCDFCLSISLLGYLLMDISIFPSIYLLSFFICIPLVNFCILSFWLIPIFLKHNLPSHFHCLHIFRVWKVEFLSHKPQAVCVRRFVPLDLQKSLRTVVFDYQKWPHVEGSCVFCLFFFRKCLWSSTHLNFYLVYIHMDI